MYLLHFTNTEGMRLELATLKDAKAIGIMSRDLIEHGLGWAWTPFRVAKHILHTNSLVIIARAEKNICGFAILQLTEKVANLSLLAIDPNFQRKGIGRDLVRFVEQSVAIAGISSIFLEVREINESALAFYQALGYCEIKRIPHYYRGQETAIRMVYQLKVPTTPDNSENRSIS